MDRRSFIKLAAASGFSVMAPTAFSRSAYGAGRRYEGPYFILIHASGGWDPTYLCDPKGSDGPVNINKLFTSGQIAPIGPFRTPPGTIDYGAGGMKPFDFVTKHASRLARDFGRKVHGDEGYAMEELVAELGSCFLSADLGIEAEPREDHASYIQAWLKALKSDKRFIFSAASHASRAADYLHGLQPKPTV